MALRLGDYVLYGELRNHRNYSTHGVLVLRTPEGAEQYALHLELTGDCCPDIKGKVVRFQPADPDADGPVFVEKEHPGLQFQQIGPTGQITAADWARVLPCSVEEYLRRSELGEPPPTPWKRRLYIEWYSQNGRVVVEMADPVIEEQVRPPDKENEEDEGDWRELPNPAPCPEEWRQENQPPPMPEITVIRQDAEGASVGEWRPVHDAAEEEVDEEEDSLPFELQRALEEEAFAVDMAISGNEPPAEDDPLYDVKMLDYCIDHVEGEPIASIIGGPETMPAADTLSDEEAEAHLKALLGQLALRNIALSLCEHYTPREAYRYLTEVILPECTFYQEMVGTGFVQHFYTGEHCAVCDEEFEKEYPEMQRRIEESMREREEHWNEEDMPF